MIARLLPLLLVLAMPVLPAMPAFADPMPADPLVKSLRPPVNPRFGPGPGATDGVSLSTSASGNAAAAPIAPAPVAAALLPEALPRPRPRPAALEAQVAALRAPAATPSGAVQADPATAPESPEPVAELTPPAAIAAAPAPPPAPAAASVKKAKEGTSFSARPKEKPTDLMQTSAAAPKSKGKEKSGKKEKESASVRGSVCGVAAIKGEKIAPITSKVQGCGLDDGVRVTSVSGVRLSMAATIDCSTAKALNTWIERVAQPAYGGKIVELRIAGHYVCRPRNNKKGAKVSEHGRGKAIDISGIVLASGKVQMVLGGFDKTMRQAHKGACGIFGTTLGPGSDGYHEDHMHFDTASHRNGAYCR